MKILGVVITIFCLSFASFVVLENRNLGDTKGEEGGDSHIDEEKSIISDNSFLHPTKDPLEKGGMAASPETTNPLPKPGLTLRLLALFQTYDQSQASAVILHPAIGAYRYHVGSSEMLRLGKTSE